MCIYYRDTIGIVKIDNVETPISFIDGHVYFSADYEDFELYANQIVEIGE